MRQAVQAFNEARDVGRYDSEREIIIEAQREVIITTPLADDVLSKVSDEDEMVVSDMLNGASSSNQKLIEQCIK